MLMFTVPIGVMAAGFSIGGRDGAIFSMVGAAALLIVSLWQAIKLVNQDDKKPKERGTGTRSESAAERVVD